MSTRAPAWHTPCVRADGDGATCGATDNRDGRTETDGRTDGRMDGGLAGKSLLTATELTTM